MPTALASLIEQQPTAPPVPSVRALTEALRSRYGDVVVAILLYGSCFRRTNDEGLVDLYVLVDDYRDLPGTVLQRLLHRVLPPTVFYLEIPFESRLVRAKYGVMSVGDFERGTSARWFHSYLWGRFAQPTGILYVRDRQGAERVHAALAQAIVTFARRVLPMIEPTFDARDLWRGGLRLSYRTELRPEQPEAVSRLYDAAPNYYEEATRRVLPLLPYSVRAVEQEGGPTRYHALIGPGTRHISRIAWGIRRAQGKALNLLRLTKGLFTFRGGVDYILWKVERHSGVRPDIPPRLQHHPWLAKGLVLWKLYRRGAFK